MAGTRKPGKRLSPRPKRTSTGLNERNTATTTSAKPSSAVVQDKNVLEVPQPETEKRESDGDIECSKSEALDSRDVVATSENAVSDEECDGKDLKIVREPVTDSLTDNLETLGDMASVSEAANDNLTAEEKDALDKLSNRLDPDGVSLNSFTAAEKEDKLCEEGDSTKELPANEDDSRFCSEDAEVERCVDNLPEKTEPESKSYDTTGLQDHGIISLYVEEDARSIDSVTLEADKPGESIDEPVSNSSHLIRTEPVCGQNGSRLPV